MNNANIEQFTHAWDFFSNKLGIRLLQYMWIILPLLGLPESTMLRLTYTQRDIALEMLEAIGVFREIH